MKTIILSVLLTISSIYAAAPPVPVQVGPLDGQKVSAGTAGNATVGCYKNSAWQYHFQISLYSNFSTILFQDTTFDTLFVVSDLDSATYYWRVRATSGTYEWSNWSSTWSFIEYNRVPVKPTLVSPIVSATNVSLTPTLVWNKSRRATSYSVGIMLNGSGIFSQANILDTFFTLPITLLRNSRYEYYVVAKNNIGTIVSDSRYLRTIPNIPATPTLLTPAFGDTNISLDAYLTWTASAGATSYNYQLTTDSTQFNLAQTYSSTTNSDTTVPLTYGWTYYWHVSAVNAGGESNWSSAGKFSTLPPLPYSPDTIYYPNKKSVNIPIITQISWSTARYTTNYQLQIATDSQYVNLVKDTTTTDTNYSANLQNNTTYYIRIMGWNISGQSSWGHNYWSFTTIPAAPSNFTLVSPEDSVINQDTSVTLTWHKSLNAVMYNLEIADSTYITTDTFKVVNLQRNNTYTWRVNAYNIADTTAWVSSTFSTIPFIPQNPVFYSDSTWSKTANSFNIQVLLDHLVIDTTITDTSFTFSKLSDTTYTLRVQAVNAGGNSQWVIKTFKTNPSLPVMPNIISELLWNSVKCDSYHVQISLDTIILDTFMTDTSMAINKLPDTLYTWKVQSMNITGNSQWNVDSIRTLPVNIEPPVIDDTVTVIDSIISDTVVTNPSLPVMPNIISELLWNSVKCDSYHIQISLDTIILDTFMTDTSMAINKLPDTLYTWKVQSMNITGNSQWNVSSIRTLPLLPTKVSLVSPLIDSIISDTVTLSWNLTSPKVTKYHLQIIDSVEYNDSTITDTSKIITTHGCTWRVRAYNISGWGEWSDTAKVVKLVPTNVTKKIVKIFQKTEKIYDLNGRLMTSKNLNPGYYIKSNGQLMLVK